jgi:polyisoprenoid-binding protein YceI
MRFQNSALFGLLFLSSFVFSLEGSALDNKGLQVVQAENAIEFKVNVGIAKHVGSVEVILGKLDIGATTGEVLTGEFNVPIDAMDTGDANRDCHMRESLGLNYDVSDFPEKHVCDSNDKLPTTGVNAVVYEFVTMQIQKVVSAETGAPVALKINEAANVIASVNWVIHGVSKLADIKASLKRLSEKNYQITGATTLKLSDFGIIVKPFLGVKADDRVPVRVNAELVEQ